MFTDFVSECKAHKSRVGYLSPEEVPLQRVAVAATA